MDNTVIETKRQVSDAGNPLQFMWVYLTVSIISVMGEFRYYPFGHTGLRAGANFLTGQRQSDNTVAQA